MSATFDTTTKAAYDAATTAAARAAAIVASLSVGGSPQGSVVVKVYSGASPDVEMGSGTMSAPWATASGGTVVIGEVSSFTVGTTGTPNANWYIKFQTEDGTRWAKGSFGLSSSSQDFKWSLANWTSGQTGTIGTATIVCGGNAVPVFTVAPSSASIAATGGTIQFTATDPDGGTILYSLTTTRSGITINSTTGLVTVTAAAAGTSGNIVVQATDGILAASAACLVTVEESGVALPVDIAAMRAAGFKIVTDYPNVYKDNSAQDSRAGIQAAIDACCAQGWPLYFPSGTYYVGDTLFLNKYSRNTGTVGSWANSPYHHTIVGNAANRPVIKVLSSSTKFNSTTITRPVVCCRTFYGYSLNTTSYPSPYIPSWLYDDPLSVTSDWIDGYGVGFWDKMTNFVVDTSNKAGAIGVFWGTCQDSWMTNVKIIATGSEIGLAGMGGCHGSADIEVIGGRYGAYTGSIRSASIASGQVGVAYRLTGQTVAAVRVSDYTPVGLVGFHIQVGSGVEPFEISTNSATANNTPYLIDGIIECDGQIALENPGVTMYARNVYVTGTSNLIKTGSLSTVTGTGTWKRIAEYSARNPNGLAGGTFGSYPERNLIHRALIDGSLNTNQQVIANVESGVSAPPSDLVSRHSPVNQIPWLDDGLPYVNIMDYGAVPYVHEGSQNLALDFGKAFYRDANWSVIQDSLSAFNAAIAAAEAAGHNRVFVPRGAFYVGGTINLRANTKLFGAGSKHSVILVRNTWVPTTSPNYLVASANSASGTATMTDLFLNVPTMWGTLNATTGQYSGDRFSKVLWRTGRRSMTWNVSTDHRYYDESKPTNDRQNFTIAGPGGGGRHYFIECNGRGNTFTTFRGLLIKDTVEPTSIYANNFEIFKSANSAIWLPYGTEWNIEITNSQNVRIYDQKREGNGGTILIHNSQNVGHWGPGVNMTTIHNDPDYTRTKISGSSNNVLVALQTNQQANYASTDRFMLTEAITGQPVVKIPNWEGIALYKRGELNDAAMTHT